MASQKTMDKALMRTEYMDRFRSPHGYKMIVRTVQKQPYHSLKGTSADATTWQRFYPAQKGVNDLPKPPQRSVKPKGQRRPSSTTHNPKPVRQQQNHQPFCLCDCSEVNEEPFESTTSYRADYVAHPVQPRAPRQKPANESVKDLLPKQTQDHEKRLSTTHADFTAHKCPRTKPILPAILNYKRSKEPIQSTTTMREDFKAWNTERRHPIIPKQEANWLKKSTSRTCCRPNHTCPNTTSRPHPELREPVVCNITHHHSQTPAENELISGFECIYDGDKESRTFWTTTVTRGGTLTHDEVCEGSCEYQQTLSCMVSRPAYDAPKTRQKKKRGTATSAWVVSASNTNKSKK